MTGGLQESFLMCFAYEKRFKIFWEKIIKLLFKKLLREKDIILFKDSPSAYFRKKRNEKEEGVRTSACFRAWGIRRTLEKPSYMF